MSISERLQQLLNNGSMSRFFGGWLSTGRPKYRRDRIASGFAFTEVFESRTLLAAAVASSVGNSRDEFVVDLPSADSPDRKISKFIVSNRWTRTATNGTNIKMGDPTTLTWSLPADGVTTDNEDNPDAPNDLRAFLDNTFGAGTGSDLTQRPWFRLFQDSLHRLEELAGLTYVYTTADDGVAMRAGNRGILNVRADVRIMGKNIDDPSNTLAYNGFPNDGDMTIDTSDTAFLSNNVNDFRAFRNVLMHEFMHGLGVEHVESSDADLLMEPFAVDTSDGPQLDDILAIQRLYGDPLEKLGGNTFSTAIDLGNIPTAGSVSRGTSGDSTIVDRSETDFVSIDDESDDDFYKFAVDSAGSVTITLTPRGASYMAGPENGTEISFNSKNQGDLTVKLLGEDGVTVLETQNAGGTGSEEVIQDFMLSSPGTYFIQVTSSTIDKVQLYGLETAYSAIPGGQILGTVFNDLNTDGIQDSGEAGIPDIRVFVDSNSNDAFDEESERFELTDSNGNYSFTELFEVGTYNIRAEFPANLQGTSPELGFHQIDLAFEEVVSDVNFGSRMLPVGTSGSDSFVLNYTADNVTITMATDGGPASMIGTFPLTSALIIDGGTGTDSVRIVGTSESDEVNVQSTSGVQVNGHALTLTSIEQRSLAGGAGDDHYVFDTDLQLGTFTLDESGGGADLLDFSSSALAVTVDLGLSNSQVVNTNLTLILGTVNKFENASGGTGNDTLFGNSLANILDGGAGNDRIIGKTGGDHLNGGIGDDTYVFGNASSTEADFVLENPSEGVDLLDFTAVTVGITLNIGEFGVQSIHTNRTLRLEGTPSIENVSTGAGNDFITGNSAANILNTGGGNDQLNGRAGNDVLIGGAGNDTYAFTKATSAEADTIIENASEGNDLLNFSSITTSITINAGSSLVQNIHTNRSLRLLGTPAIENITTGPGGDKITGNDLANTLNTGGGNDRLIGGAGSDSLIGGAGNDTYEFAMAASAESDSVTEFTGGGTDTLDFSAISTDLMLSLEISEKQFVHAKRTLNLTSHLYLENVIGGSANDVLIGNNSANQLIGNGGRDILVGGRGRDSLFGGTGDDILISGPVNIQSGSTATITFTQFYTKLRQIWTSAAGYVQRVENIHSPQTAGTGKVVYLRATTTQVQSTKVVRNVFSDPDVDTLAGNTGIDFFFSGALDLTPDRVANESLDLVT